MAADTTPDPASVRIGDASAAVVLVGGASRRMGAPKAALLWQGRPLLDHVVDVLGRAVDGPVVLAAASGQVLPPTPSIAPERLLRVDDAVRSGGPMVGLDGALSALRAAPTATEALFAAAVDLPLLSVALVRRVLALLRADPAADVALPHIDGRAQPLAAAWRPRVAPEVRRRVEAGEGGFRGLLGALHVLELDAATLLADPTLRAADPHLEGLRDIDDPGELAALLQRRGS